MVKHFFGVSVSPKVLERKLFREFTTVFQHGFPVVFEGTIFKRLLVKRLHELNTCLIKSTAHVLHDMKSINNNLSVRKEFWNHWDVTARHINGNDFHTVPSLFRIPEEIIANSCLCPILKDGDDFLGLKILCNEGKLSF